MADYPHSPPSHPPMNTICRAHLSWPIAAQSLGDKNSASLIRKAPTSQIRRNRCESANSNVQLQNTFFGANLDADTQTISQNRGDKVRLKTLKIVSKTK